MHLKKRYTGPKPKALLKTILFAYREGGSCTDALIMIQHKVCKHLDDPECKAVRLFAMDFSKAFDSVSHQLLANKLKNLPLNPYIINWWLSFLRDRKQRIVHRNVTCNWKTVNKGITQGSVSGPYLFIIFLNDLDVQIGAEQAIIKCADDCTIVAPVMKGHDFSPDLIRQFVGWTETNSMNCNSSKCKELVFRKKGYTDVYSTISGIPQSTELKIVGLTFQPNCMFDIHVKSKLVKAKKCLYVIRTLHKEGCTQVEVDHLFKALVLPNITHALAVYGAAEPELTTAQQFLHRCYNRKYISKKLGIYQFLEKRDKKIFKKASFLSSHPLHTNLPKTKQVTYSIRSKSSARPLINTNRCKHTFINRLTFNYNLTV